MAKANFIRAMSTDNSSSTSDLIGASLASSAANDDLHPEDVRPRSPAEALEPARAPEPPARRKRRRPHPFFIVVNGMMTVLVVALFALGGVIYFAKVQFDQPGPLTHSTVVAVPKGEGVNAIAARLEREGIISDRRIFVASVIYFKAQEKLKAGEYEIRKGASMREVLDQLVRGKSILYKITIPEGLTSEQAVERLRGEELLVGEITEIPPEGSLMPDTYKFSRGMTRQEIVERMQAEQRKFLRNLWETRADDLPLKTVEEAMILASIVEKEARRADERAKVAGVFINRLRKGMRLQSDPTIIYGITNGSGTLGRPIQKDEIAQKTPYNTYVIKGLPPGPIANPGRAAIEAVLNPAKTDDLYFVADGTGGHAFASNLAEHNKNVARWREIERQIREREAAEAKQKEEAERAKLEQAVGPAVEEASAAQPETGSSIPETVPGLDITTGVPGLSVSETSEVHQLDIPQSGSPTLSLPKVSGTALDASGPSPQAAETPAGSGVPLPLRKPKKTQ